MEGQLVGAKPWWRSKTIWANILPVVLAILALMADDQLIAKHPQAVSAVLLAIGMVNIVLRSITNQPISRGGQR